MKPQRIARVALNELQILHSFFHKRLAGMDKDAVRGFHRLYYDSYVWNDTRWMGVPVMKCPMDLMTYQEILWETKPDVIIETGTAYGGSALFLAHLCDAMGKGRVITIDMIRQEDLPHHPRIEYLQGSSSVPETLALVRDRIQPGETAMAILDSDHTASHVLSELRAYAPLISAGHYMIVEDTNVNNHPVYPAFGPGPFEAAEAFVLENPDFIADRAREKFFMTFNPSGFLKCVR